MKAPSDNVPVLKDLVLLGGGHSHLSVLRMLGMKPVPGVRITLITRDIQTPYSGMLPGYIAGAYTFDECHIDLTVLSTFAKARLVHAEASGLDLVNKQVLFKDRPAIPFDVLSIDIGITPASREVPGAMEFTTPVKPIDKFVKRFEDLIERSMSSLYCTPSAALENGGGHDNGEAHDHDLTPQPLKIAIVGGGAGGIEVALSLQHRLNLEYEKRVKALPPATSQRRPAPRVFLFTRGELLEGGNNSTRLKARSLLVNKGVRVNERAAVQKVEKNTLVLADGSTFTFDECLWCTQASAAPWIESTGLDTDERGFIAIWDTLQSTSHPFVFAAGDVASCARHPRPKAGVFAVRQGPPLAKNLSRFLRGKKPESFTPQTNYLSIISAGVGYAIASRNRWAVEGAWVWNLKDHIDRSFMHKFSRDLPRMDDGLKDVASLSPVATGPEAVAVLTASKMRCGGCGAKVGSTSLARVLARLSSEFKSLVDHPDSKANDVLIGLESPDDAAVLRPPPPGHVMVQTVDFFRSFVDDPYLFGKIAANHALSDVYAMGGRPTTALAIAVVPYASEDKVEDALYQMMAGALTVLEEAGCVLSGGHSCEGQELALGFTITGTCQESAIIRKGGAKPGDVILLTKPLGTGVLFAGAMRRLAKGRWISKALDHMCQGNGPASEVFKSVGCHALTDVTGFGLVGHLHEILKASGMKAEFDIDALPLLEGALDLAEQGVMSSLQAQNAKAAAIVRNAGDIASSSQGARWSLMLDPQTSGGLVGCVAPDKAEECLKKLREAGYTQAAVIGTIIDGGGLPPTPRSKRDSVRELRESKGDACDLPPLVPSKSPIRASQSLRMSQSQSLRQSNSMRESQSQVQVRQSQVHASQGWLIKVKSSKGSRGARGSRGAPDVTSTSTSSATAGLPQGTRGSERGTESPTPGPSSTPRTPPQ